MFGRAEKKVDTGQATDSKATPTKTDYSLGEKSCGAWRAACQGRSCVSGEARRGASVGRSGEGRHTKAYGGIKVLWGQRPELHLVATLNVIRPRTTTSGSGELRLSDKGRERRRVR